VEGLPRTTVAALNVREDPFERCVPVARSVGCFCGPRPMDPALPRGAREGEWKCWWADVKEIFTISRSATGEVAVAVDGRPAQVQTDTESTLVFVLPPQGHCGDGTTRYTIDYTNEYKPKCNVEDVDEEGNVYNCEWGWVVPGSEEFEPH